MGTFRSAGRKLKPIAVRIACETQQRKLESVKKMLDERIKGDVTFAKEILENVGDALPPELKAAAEEAVAKTEATIKKLPDGLAFTNPVPVAFDKA